MSLAEPKNRFLQKAPPILRALRLIFTFAFLFLWFKDNFDPFKKIRVGAWTALVPLLVALGLEFALKFRKGRSVSTPESKKIVLVLLAVVLLTIAVRLPFLLYSAGMMWSDEAIPALMAKHIAEGKVPPICHYGQHYLGSLGPHIYAVAFALFGYSIPLLKAVTVLMYLAFIILQFFLFREFFSLTWAAVLCLFYSLPLGQLIDISTNNANPYALVLFLEAALLYTAYAIAYKNKNRLWPLLGFLMGLSFWTHQITAAFILTAFLVVVFKARPVLKKIGILFLYAAAGGFPLVLQEIFDGFQLLRFMAGGEKAVWGQGKSQATLKLIQSLLLARDNAAGPVLLLLLLAGTGILIYVSFKKKESARLRIFLIFLAVFAGLYAYSGFSSKIAVRYLFPLYVCLPVLLAAPFLWIKSRLKYLLFAGLLVSLVFLGNVQTQYTYFLSVKDSSRYFEQVIAAMKATGNRFWRGSFETAYVLTSNSHEQVIVNSFGVNKYFPYRLLYDNQAPHDNYVFLKGPGTAEAGAAENLNRLLSTLGIPFKRKDIDGGILVYDILSPVFPRDLSEAVPSQIPQLEAAGLESRDGYLHLAFKNSETRESARYRLNVEIPGYASISKMFPGSSEQVTCSIPLPEDSRFTIKYYLDYQALRIPSTVREIPYAPPAQAQGKRKEPFVYLQGIGPKVRFSGREVRFCDKEASFEILLPPGKKATVKLRLFSPFDFANAYWYGNYAQQVRILLENGHVIEQTLRDGTNIVAFDLDRPEGRPGPVKVKIEFRYHLLFDFANLRKTAALLEDAGIE
jgi:hypothetical protein